MNTSSLKSLILAAILFLKDLLSRLTRFSFGLARFLLRRLKSFLSHKAFIALGGLLAVALTLAIAKQLLSGLMINLRRYLRARAKLTSTLNPAGIPENPCISHLSP